MQQNFAPWSDYARMQYILIYNCSSWFRGVMPSWYYDSFSQVTTTSKKSWTTQLALCCSLSLDYWGVVTFGVYLPLPTIPTSDIFNMAYVTPLATDVAWQHLRTLLCKVARMHRPTDVPQVLYAFLRGTASRHVCGLDEPVLVCLVAHSRLPECVIEKWSVQLLCAFFY